MVGGGISGLTVAWALRDSGAQVTVLEADDRLGGQVRTEVRPELGGLAVDLGAESIHLGAPHLAGLVEALGLTDAVEGSLPGASNLVTRRGLRPLPAGVAPSGPTRLLPVLRSGVLSPAGLLRAAQEPLRARRRFTSDVSVGAFVRHRFGDEVADTLVDPLLGNLHAGDIDRLSLPSVAPMLAPAAREGRSLLRWRRRPAPAGPLFASFPEGLGRLVTELARQSGAEVHTGTPARRLDRTDQGWSVVTDRGDHRADTVVLTTGAATAGSLLEPDSPGIGTELAETPVADVATVALAYPRAAAEQALTGTGVLLRSDSGRTLKAATWLTRKWARLDHPELFLVRASAGRARSDELAGLDDDALTRRITAELAELTGLPPTPTGSVVTRWPTAFPQLEVGAGERMARVRRRLAGSGVVLCGAAFGGLGLSSTIAGAQRVAAELAAPPG